MNNIDLTFWNHMSFISNNPEEVFLVNRRLEHLPPLFIQNKRLGVCKYKKKSIDQRKHHLGRHLRQINKCTKFLDAPVALCGIRLGHLVDK